MDCRDLITGLLQREVPTFSGPKRKTNSFRFFADRAIGTIAVQRWIENVDHFRTENKAFDLCVKQRIVRALRHGRACRINE